jgi:predicted transglutaminase-like cysteine proteinase
MVLVLSAQRAFAGPLLPDAEAVPTSEPFAMNAKAQPDVALLDKWQTVTREIEAEQEIIALCEEDRTHCRSAAALRFLGIVDNATTLEGRARIGVINRSINLAIRPADDGKDGAVDEWSSPLATLAKGAGDCEDYAIAKLLALRAAGVDADDMRLTIVHDVRRAQDHAVVAVRLDQRWLILDNQRLVMLEDKVIRNVRPAASIDSSGVWRIRMGGDQTS